MAEPWLSADDIVRNLGVATDTGHSWIAEKAMPAHNVGRLWKFKASEINDWVRAGAAASDHEISVAHPGVVGSSNARGNDEQGQGSRWR